MPTSLLKKLRMFSFAIAATLALNLSAQSPDLTQTQASSGLQEALSHCVSAAIASTGSPGGYFENPEIKIPMPPSLENVEKGLRAVGMGPMVDEFVKTMNAAAEEAAPQAMSILVDALKQMTFEDAKSIVMGGDHAATDYFRRTSTPRIKEAFRPIVKKAMAHSGATEQFGAIMAKASAIPFMKTPGIDIDEYVLDQTVEGFFVVMAEEEAKIRTNPAAQVTPILKAVFGHY
jgi:hypothetical protein